MVRDRGIEPLRLVRSMDFKSTASTVPPISHVWLRIILRCDAGLSGERNVQLTLMIINHLMAVREGVEPNLPPEGSHGFQDRSAPLPSLPFNNRNNFVNLLLTHTEVFKRLYHLGSLLFTWTLGFIVLAIIFLCTFDHFTKFFNLVIS